MKRKTFSLVLALAGVLIFGQVGSGAAAPQKQLKLDLPRYSQLDADLAKEMAAAGQKVTGKRYHDFRNEGKSYKSPIKDGRLNPLDVRGHGRKGLAILIDWEANPDGTSQVPGVNYDPLPQSLFDDLVNGDSYNPYTLELFNWLADNAGTPAPTHLTMKNYYNEVSYGQFSMNVDMVGWVTMPRPYDYYLDQNKGHYNDNGDAMMGELLRDALMAADAAGIDFSQYAVPAAPGDFEDLYGSAAAFVDKSGNTVNMIVPNLFIIHRGTGAEYSLDPSLIWSHKWSYLSANYWSYYYRTGSTMPVDQLDYLVLDGVAINTYNIVPEVGQDITEYYTGPRGLPKRPPSPPYVGVFAHEFGHVLGLPDLYDYGYDSEGVGMFSLMAGGSYGRSIQNRWYSGNSPVHMDAWSKYYLGFAQPAVINPSSARQSVTLRPVAAYPDILRVNIPGSNGTEYFLLENRQQRGFDLGLEYNVDGKALHGLVAYQVDENVMIRDFHGPNDGQSWDLNKRGAGSRPRSDNGETHYALSVLQADGRFDMEKSQNDGDAGDVFPGKLGMTTLSSGARSAPNTLSWVMWQPGTQYTGIALQNIVEHEDGSITLEIVYQ